MSLQEKQWKEKNQNYNGKRIMSTASGARLRWPLLLPTAWDRQLYLWPFSYAAFCFGLIINLQPWSLT